jgi:hypothetical protein
MRVVKLGIARNVMVYLVSSTDHVTPKTGLTLAITASKDGAAFASISPTVTERGNGWYTVALTAAHTDTLGDLAIRATGTGADEAAVLMQVVAYDFADAVRLGLTAMPNAAADTAGGMYVLGGTGVAVASNADKTGYSLGTAPLDAAGVRAAVGLAAANLDSQLGTTGVVLSAAAQGAIADKVLSRSLTGGADGGRTVREALYSLRNRVVVSGGTMTVYATDDTTPAWTAAVTTTAGANPVTGVDPT